MDQQSSAMAVIDGVAMPACFPAAPVLIGSEVYRHSIYGRRHPLSIARVSATLDLIAALGWHDPAGYIDSPLASADALARFHTPEYIAAIMDAEATGQVAPEVRDRFNIGRNGNPVFPEIFRRPATAAGASILAAQMLAGVAGGTVYSPAGGTHHGRADQASGFCYFNDPVLAILTLRDAGIGPILYVDLDAHHGDGVEAAFAADEQVLTVSIHEEGRWPGTGKRGERAGGAARNLPVPVDFNDSELAFLIAEAVLPLARRWRPAALVLQTGVDALADDPQSKLTLSNGAIWAAVRDLLPSAPRRLVVGGGGYNPWAVARAWTGIWGVIAGHAPPSGPLPPAAEAVLRDLTWNHSRGRNPPDHWFTTLADAPRPGPIRPAVEDLAAEVLA